MYIKVDQNYVSSFSCIANQSEMFWEYHLVAVTETTILVPSHHCQVTATYLKIGHQWNLSKSDWFSNKLLGLDLKIGHKHSRSNTGHQGNMSNCDAMTCFFFFFFFLNYINVCTVEIMRSNPDLIHVMSLWAFFMPFSVLCPSKPILEEYWRLFLSKNILVPCNQSSQE